MGKEKDTENPGYVTEAFCNERTKRIEDAINGVRDKTEASYKKTLIYVAVVAVVVSLLSNLDKIVAPLRALIK